MYGNPEQHRTLATCHGRAWRICERFCDKDKDNSNGTGRSGRSGAVPTVHQDNNRKARFPLHSTSHLELAAKDSSGQ